MLTKSCDVHIKAAGEAEGLEEGQFTALVSVFGNKDSYGDIVRPGAFKETLAEWKASGNPIPCYYSHRMDDPDYCIGEVLEATETEAGLEVKVQLDLDNDKGKAKQTYRLMKGRRVTQFSFAYDVLDGGFETSEDDGEHYELRKLKLYEVGPTPIGANSATELIGIKAFSEMAARTAADVKAGRVLSAKNEASLRDAHTQLSAAVDQLAEVLSAVDTTTPDDQEKAQPEEPGKASRLGQDGPSTPMPVGPVKGLETRLARLSILSLDQE